MDVFVLNTKFKFSFVLEEVSEDLLSVSSPSKAFLNKENIFRLVRGPIQLEGPRKFLELIETL